MISCNILDFSDLPEVTTCEGLDENDDDIYSQGLCIPMDRLDELEFFPNFNDDLIALTQLEQDYLKGCDGIELSHDGQQRLEVDLYEKQEGNLDDDNDECLRDGADDQKLNICEEDFQLEANYSDEGEVSDSRLSTQNYTKKRKSDDDDNDDEEQYTYNYTKKRKSGSDNDDYIGDGGVNNDDDCIGDGEISCIFKKPRSKSRRIKRTSGTKSLYWQMFSNYTNMERRCFHCQAEKTPQWRMGPNGPNTLCNACGVRYASGRLLPEYRPAASPTFDSTKHSNFHKRIIRQKKSYVVKKKKKSCTNNAHEEFMNEGV